jgi:hypothetical protein
MVFDRLFKRGEDKQSKEQMKLALSHGVLAGESSRPQTTQEQMMQLGINIHTIEDENVVDTINAFIKFCGEQGIVDFDLFALRNLVTKLIRTSRLDRIDAYILSLKARQILRRIEMNMPNELVEIGVLNYIESIEIVLATAFCDSIGGWKAKLLKVTPRYFEITMPEQKKNQKTWMGQ